MPMFTPGAPVDFYHSVALWRQFGPTAKLISARGNNMALADTLLYTVPAGKKAVLVPANGAHAAQIQAYNPTAGAAVVKQYVVPSGQAVGLNYQINQQSIGATSGGLMTVAALVVMNAGDQMYINPGVAGLNIWMSFIEADVADMPVAGNYVGAIGNTATLLYTVPTGKKAFLSNTGYGAFNQSGLAATLQFWVVQSGAAADATTLSTVSASIASLTRAAALGSAPYVLQSGDAIYAAGSVAGSFNVWAFVALEP